MDTVRGIRGSQVVRQRSSEVISRTLHIIPGVIEDPDGGKRVTMDKDPYREDGGLLVSRGGLCRTYQRLFDFVSLSTRGNYVSISVLYVETLPRGTKLHIVVIGSNGAEDRYGSPDSALRVVT